MQLFHQIEELKAIAAPVVLTVGFFDGMHVGHLELIERLRQAARQLNARSLVISFANSPKNYHLRLREGEACPRWRYLMTAEEKAELISACGIDALLLLEYDE